MLHSDERKSGCVLALDVGRKRIGLAVSDELGITAQGIETLYRTRIREDMEKLKIVAQARKVSLLLVGRPLHMNGTESPQSRYTEEFGERLSKYLDVPVVYWDERLTSMEAERMLRAAAASLDEKKRAVDRLSAVLLLESYLEYLRNGNNIAREDSLG